MKRLNSVHSTTYVSETRTIVVVQSIDVNRHRLEVRSVNISHETGFYKVEDLNVDTFMTVDFTES